MSVPSAPLASGYSMPLVGFGIWKVPQDTTASTVYSAIKSGYRLFDGAYDYQNEAQLGEGVRKAIADGLVKREDIFITTKLWNNFHSREHALEFAKKQNETIGLGYIDLYLIHFPVAQEYIDPAVLQYPAWWSDNEQKTVTPRAKVPIHETWTALESLVKTDANPNGFIRSIGISNFSTQLIYDLLAYAKIPPSVLQIEHHPYLTQPGLVAMAKENNIAITAYSTFGPSSFLELKNARAVDTPLLFDNEIVKSIAAKHGKTAGQVLLRWCTQRGIAVIPKSNNEERLKQNLEVCGFDLTKEDIEAISGLDKGLRFNDPGFYLDVPLRIFS